MNKNIAPFKFLPIFKTVLWGGERIAPFKGIETVKHDIGESWEISGVPENESIVASGKDRGMTLSELIEKYQYSLVGTETYNRFNNRFPLLVKFIDAKHDLSVQVHPNDEIAKLRHNASGKSEMWYIIDADPKALIYSGLKHPISSDEYVMHVDNNSIMDVIQANESHSGDVFYLPSGRIHSIGAGNFLLEIQQTSDITYRIYDFNRVDTNGKNRELHTHLAKDAIDYKVYDSYVTPHVCAENQLCTLIKCDFFNVYKVLLNGEVNLNYADFDSFVIAVCVKGEAYGEDNNGNSFTMTQGETVLIPASTDNFKLSGKATIILATL